MVQIYFKSEFSNGELQEELYIVQPEGFEAEGQECKVMILHKALYEVRKAARVLKKSKYKLVAALVIRESEYDESLDTRTETDGIQAIIGACVNGMLIVGSDM